MSKELKVQDDSLAYVMMDAEDEKQIIAEMRGEVIKAFVYSFESKGKRVTGLSKVGVDNVCRESANKGEVFRVIGDPIIKDEEEAINVVVKVGRFSVKGDGKEIMLDTTLGAKRQAKKKYSYGKLQNDPFFFESALSKAERNAKRKLLPEKLVIEMIKKFVEQGQVKHIEPPKMEVPKQEPKEEVWKSTPMRTAEEILQKPDEYIDEALAIDLNKMRAKYEKDTGITKEMLRGFLKTCYNVDRMSQIKLADYNTIFNAVQNKVRFDKLCEVKGA